MNKINLTLFAIIFVPSLVFACSITSYDKIIKINKILDDSIVKESDCDYQTITIFKEVISSATGDLRSTHLSQILRSEFSKDVSIHPRKISIQNIQDSLSSLIKLPNDLIIKKASSLFHKASINLNNISKATLSATCMKCLSPGKKNIKIFVNRESIWFSADILQKRVGFISTKEVSPYSQSLSRDQFKTTYIFDNGRSPLFQDIDNIRFYKATRQIQKGKTLKLTDFTPINIIQAGKKIKVILRGKSMSMSSTALSRSSGKIGQFIEVYNQKTNKKISGKVIDFNTVMVNI